MTGKKNKFQRANNSTADFVIPSYVTELKLASKKIKGKLF